MEKDIFLKKISEYSDISNLNLISKAYDFCYYYHNGQRRESGDNYSTHPMEVAIEIAKAGFDEETIIAGLLHDTIEDTVMTKSVIEKEFSYDVAEIVDGVTKLDQIKFSQRNIKNVENFRKLFLALSKDIRVLVVKLFDRLHNTRTLKYRPVEKQKKVAIETMEIFAPLAERIGLNNLKKELYNTSFKILYPEENQKIVQEVQKIKSSLGDTQPILRIVDELKSLMDKNKIECKVFGREKTTYSIWKKIQRKKYKSIGSISDIIGFRIICKNIDECYKILGTIHTNYHAMPSKFVDYISTPKPNNYRSIHTSIVGPGNFLIEIQIRTERMHLDAEYGLAVHWKYKQNISNIEKNKLYAEWIKKVLKIFDDTENPSDLMDQTKTEISSDKILVMDERGILHEIESDSKILDFVYNRNPNDLIFFEYAKVNDQDVDLDYIIEDGDIVRVKISDKITIRKEMLNHTNKKNTKNHILLLLNRQKENEQVLDTVSNF